MTSPVEVSTKFVLAEVGIQGAAISDLTGQMIATRVAIDSVVTGYQQAMRQMALLIGGIGIIVGLFLRTPRREDSSLVTAPT
jgi:hypothetical protein